jgi:hypothetical protein
MTWLLYHPEDSYAHGLSPFDEAIRETADSRKVYIVCPYISPSYLKSVLASADEADRDGRGSVDWDVRWQYAGRDTRVDSDEPRADSPLS